MIAVATNRCRRCLSCLRRNTEDSAPRESIPDESGVVVSQSLQSLHCNSNNSSQLGPSPKSSSQRYSGTEPQGEDKSLTDNDHTDNAFNDQDVELQLDVEDVHTDCSGVDDTPRSPVHVAEAQVGVGGGEAIPGFPGWEKKYHPQYGYFYIDHNTFKTHWEHPDPLMRKMQLLPGRRTHARRGSQDTGYSVSTGGLMSTSSRPETPRNGQQKQSESSSSDAELARHGDGGGMMAEEETTCESGAALGVHPEECISYPSPGSTTRSPLDLSSVSVHSSDCGRKKGWTELQSKEKQPFLLPSSQLPEKMEEHSSGCCKEVSASESAMPFRMRLDVEERVACIVKRDGCEVEMPAAVVAVCIKAADREEQQRMVARFQLVWVPPPPESCIGQVSFFRWNKQYAALTDNPTTFTVAIPRSAWGNRIQLLQADYHGAGKGATADAPLRLRANAEVIHSNDVPDGFETILTVEFEANAHCGRFKTLKVTLPCANFPPAQLLRVIANPCFTEKLSIATPHFAWHFKDLKYGMVYKLVARFYTKSQPLAIEKVDASFECCGELVSGAKMYCTMDERNDPLDFPVLEGKVPRMVVKEDRPIHKPVWSYMTP